MTRNRKIAVSVGVFALLLGVGVNMQVSALNPKLLKNNVIQKGIINPEDNISAQVSPEDDKTSIKVKDVEIWVGDEWKAEDNFVESITGLGNKAPFYSVTVEGNVDTKKPGIYYVTYSVLNCAKERVEAKGMVTVKVDRASIEAKNSTLKVGAKWKAEDNFVNATTGLGNKMPFKEVMVKGADDVDTSKAGTYTVSYSVYNCKQKKISATATITVQDGSQKDNKDNKEIKKDQTKLIIKDSDLYVGDKWEPVDNLINLISASGLKVNAKSVIDHGTVRVEGKVNTSKAGTYQVVYWTINCESKKIAATATINVKNKAIDKTDVKVKDSTIYVGDKWQAGDNLVSASDENGRSVSVKGLVVKGSVDTKKAGINKVTYMTLNRAYKEVSKEATITVKARATDEPEDKTEDKTDVKVKDSTIYVGDEWKAEDNLVSATDADGKSVSIKDLVVEGSVDTTKTGDNEVTYTIVNKKGEKISEKANITVNDKDNGGDNNKNKEDNKDKKDDNLGMGGGADNDGGAQLPKTGYDVSMITGLIGLAGALGVGSIYLRRRQGQE